MKRIAALLAALALATTLAAPVRAEIADGDRAAIQSMIASQIDAFRHDDGPAAYNFASPAIQGLYPTVESFMTMVEKGYPPVYRPQAFTFGPARETANGIMQRVFITGPDGASYVAEYSMQRQPDGTWKINGCALIKNTGPTI
jgi:hypothetical protein